MRMNVASRSNVRTHEGGPAFAHISVEQQLRRSVMSCLLWEKSFYEDGASIAERIAENADKAPATLLAELAHEARASGLRHAPLLLLSALAKHQGALVGDTIANTIQRADELAEFLAIYWRDGKRPLSKQVKIGLGRALGKFDEYQLAKYDRAGPVRLRDVMFLTHPKPADEVQAALWKRLADQELATPDTWEIGLSSGGDKKETFERLLRDGKLGYMALLRNLRNMTDAGVDTGLVRKALLTRKGAGRVLPFRYVAAARACPQMEPIIDQALSEAISELPPLDGKTVVLVDVSTSMYDGMSSRSDLTRMDAAAALASVIHGDLRVFSFSAGNGRYWGDEWDGRDVLVEVPPRRGMAGVDAVIKSQEHGGTLLGRAVHEANEIPHDRMIVITDEQSSDPVPGPRAKGYMINVASYQNGVGYGAWTHIDGFSENVIRYIHESERASRSLH